MLLALGVDRCSLLSNNPKKRDQLVNNGIDVTELRPTGVFVTDLNREYLKTKVDQAGHTLALATPLPVSQEYT